MNLEKLFNKRCLDVLTQQFWRGNIRELRSVVERHFVDSEVREVGLEFLERLGLKDVLTFDKPLWFGLLNETVLEFNSRKARF